jgi:predicted hydrolase (HD superfamily)
MKLIITTVAIVLILGSNITVGIAADVVPITNQQANYMVLANIIATQYAVKTSLTKKIINCESSYKSTATHITKREQSYGLVQINRLAHPTISINQAEDPTYAITYLASNLATGNGHQWSCYPSK